MPRAAKGAAPGAPRPKIAPAATPLTKRRGFRWTALVAALAIALIVVISVLGQTGRSRALRAYDADLREAIALFEATLSPTAPQSFASLPQRFTQGQVTPAELQEAASEWESNFAAAAGGVRALNPPVELEAAQNDIAQALDFYATIAGLYGLLAEHKLIADDATGNLAERLQTQSETLTRRIEEASGRASALYGAGLGAVEELKSHWGVPAA
ncbi:MAG TPA: hypothetical protein VGB83_04310 [Actinomycetota bacterium]